MLEVMKCILTVNQLTVHRQIFWDQISELIDVLAPQVTIAVNTNWKPAEILKACQRASILLYKWMMRMWYEKAHFENLLFG